jgi:transposase InsO family protein
MSRCLLDLLSEVTSRCKISLRRGAAIVGVPRSSYNRWKSRDADRKELVRPPGPRKMVAADISAITRAVAGLSHGDHRTAGVASLFGRYREVISRRDLQALINSERLRQIADRRDGYDEVHWQGAGIVWAMDDTVHNERDSQGNDLHIHHVRDIGARYSLAPMAGTGHAHTMEVAANLHALCDRYGAPLFLKRDNSGNLNTPDVDEVLALFCVIPFNSPLCLPAYNGAMERSQGILKTELARQLTPAGKWCASTAEPFVRAAAYEINHMPLPSLKGSCACHYRATSMRTFTKNERKSIYDCITQMRETIFENEGNRISIHTAQRWAVTAWLFKAGLMYINRH